MRQRVGQGAALDQQGMVGAARGRMAL
jgi:hypothetical protein